MPVYSKAMTSRRPAKRLNPNAEPSGTPMSVLNSRAVPDTLSDSATISNRAASLVTINWMAWTRPLRISSIIHSFAQGIQISTSS